MSEYIEIMGKIIGVMDGCTIQKMKDDETVQNVNPDIEINENNENNQQETDKKEQENNNDNLYEE